MIESHFALPLARVQFQAMVKYFKGFFPVRSKSANPSWANMAEQGSIFPLMAPHHLWPLRRKDHVQLQTDNGWKNFCLKFLVFLSVNSWTDVSMEFYSILWSDRLPLLWLCKLDKSSTLYLSMWFWHSWGSIIGRLADSLCLSLLTISATKSAYGPLQ